MSYFCHFNASMAHLKAEYTYFRNISLERVKMLEKKSPCFGRGHIATIVGYNEQLLLVI